MKKYSLLMAAAALTALASCSNEELIEVNEAETISFRAALSNNPSARGEDMDYAKLTGFYVSGVDEKGTLHFRNRFFEKNETFFELPEGEHILWPDGTLKFYAFAFTPSAKMIPNKTNDDPTAVEQFHTELNDNIGGDVEITGSTNVIKNFSPKAIIGDQIDLVTATASADKHSSAGGVELTFKHALTQVEVHAKSNNHIYGFKIAGYKLANIGSEGTYNFDGTSSNVWNMTVGKRADYSVTYDIPFTLTGEAVEISQSKVSTIGHPMLIPQELTPWEKTNTNGAYLAVLLQVYNKRIDTKIFPKNDDAFGWAMVPINTKWTAGTRVVYTLDFTDGAGYDEGGDPILEGPIYFTATVEGWQSADKSINMKTDSSNSPVSE